MIKAGSMIILPIGIDDYARHLRGVPMEATAVMGRKIYATAPGGEYAILQEEEVREWSGGRGAIKYRVYINSHPPYELRMARSVYGQGTEAVARTLVKRLFVDNCLFRIGRKPSSTPNRVRINGGKCRLLALNVTERN